MSLDADGLMRLITSNLRDAIRDGRADCPATFWHGKPYKGGEGSATVTLGQTKITILTTDRTVIEALLDAETEKLQAIDNVNEAANDAIDSPFPARPLSPGKKICPVCKGRCYDPASDSAAHCGRCGGHGEIDDD